MEIISTVNETGGRSGSILIVSQKANDVIYLNRIDPRSGTTLWSKHLLYTEEFIRSGHDLNHVGTPKGEAFVRHGNTIPELEQVLRYEPNFKLDRRGAHTYRSQVGYEDGQQGTVTELFNLLNEELVHETAVAGALLRTVHQDGDILTLVAQGRIGRIWDDRPSLYEYDGEGVLKVALESGSVLSYKPMPITAHVDHDGYLWNQRKVHKPHITEFGQTFVGSHTLIHFAIDGAIDTLGFDVPNGSFLTIVDRSRNSVTCLVRSEDEHEYLWKVLIDSRGLNPHLIAVSTASAPHFSQIHDTSWPLITIRYHDGFVSAYPLQTSVPSVWSTPLWSIDVKNSIFPEIGPITTSSRASRHQGIHSTDSLVLLLGEFGVASIHSKSGCQRTYPWLGYSESAAKDNNSLLVHPNGENIFFDLGRDFGLIRVRPDCLSNASYYVLRKSGDYKLIYNHPSRILIVLDRESKVLNVYGESS